MAKRTQKWEAWAEMPHLTETVEQEIAKGVEDTLEKTPSPRCIAWVISVSRRYLSHKTHLKEKPRPSDIRKTLENLHKRVKPLVEAFEQLDDATRLWFAQNQGYTEEKRAGVRTPDEVYVFLEQLQNNLTGLHWRLLDSLRALSRDPDKGGVPTNDALDLYIMNLAQIYKTETGRNPKLGRGRKTNGTRNGPFMRFLEACLKPIDPDLFRDDGTSTAEQKVDNRLTQRVSRLFCLQNPQEKN